MKFKQNGAMKPNKMSAADDKNENLYQKTDICYYSWAWNKLEGHYLQVDNSKRKRKK